MNRNLHLASFIYCYSEVNRWKDDIISLASFPWPFCFFPGLYCLHRGQHCLTTMANFNLPHVAGDIKILINKF